MVRCQERTRKWSQDMQQLAPDYLYTPQGFQANRVVSISDNGYIDAIRERGPKSEITTALPGMALLPGFVNTHSHAFQRALRGRTHHARSARDTFWTWRQAMYDEAQRLTPDSIYQITLQTYREMLAAGYTSVGEFHYVHHQPNGALYERANRMAEAVIQAGRDAGIRVVLLLTAYARGDFQQPPSSTQQRFCDASLDAFLARAEELRTSGAALGIAPHSVRAVPEDWLQALAAYSRLHHLPFHIHADEQMAEIEQCQQVHHCTPIELLARCGALDANTTIIHATHAKQSEIALLAQQQARVCVCPTTEGDLGDGIAPYAELLAAHIHLCIGSDSNTRIDPLEELRWAEYSARMRYQRRRILIADEQASPGPLLLSYGTRVGAAALGLATGSIEPGMAADFVAVDLHAPELQGWTPDDLLDTLCFGASSAVFAQTWVQGKQVWQGSVV
jgi:formimidoylglutamate deiminase